MRHLMIAAAFALSACASAPAPSLEVAGDRLFIDATVNGVAVEALLDSAAEISLADKAWAAANGLETAGVETVKGTGGTAEITFVESVDIETLGVTLKGNPVAVLDLSDISRRLIGRQVHFIMGRELFDQERLSIDIEDGAITAGDRAREPAGVRLPLIGAHGVEAFRARVNGVEVDAEFDLGNGTEVLIGKAFAEQLGLLNELSALERRKGGGIGGEIERLIVHLPTLEFAGVAFRDVEAAVDETENAGDLNIGVRLLRKFLITTDFSERAIWLAPR